MISQQVLLPTEPPPALVFNRQVKLHKVSVCCSYLPMLDSVFTVLLISLGSEHTVCLMGFDRILVVRGSGLPSQLVTAWYHSAR